MLSLSIREMRIWVYIPKGRRKVDVINCGFNLIREGNEEKKGAVCVRGSRGTSVAEDERRCEYSWKTVASLKGGKVLCK